jgi:hypothetical protein
MGKNRQSAEVGDTLMIMVDNYGNVTDKDGVRKTFRLDVIAKTAQGYVVYVPKHILIPHARKLTKTMKKKFGADERYIGCYIVAVGFDSISNIIVRTDGTHCAHCSKFYQYAVANQSDGTLICYSCRENPYRPKIGKNKNKFRF